MTSIVSDNVVSTSNLSNFGMLSRRAGLSAIAGLSCISPCATGFEDAAERGRIFVVNRRQCASLVAEIRAFPVTDVISAAFSQETICTFHNFSYGNNFVSTSSLVRIQSL